MDLGRLSGPQYVRLAPGAAESVAPYVGIPAAEIEEFVLDLESWPESIRPVPLRALDGRLIAGDPLLLAASPQGLVFAGREAGGDERVVIRWDDVRELRVLERAPIGAR